MLKIQLPETAPDLVGQLGKAWRLDLAAIAAKIKPGSVSTEATVCGYIVHAPYAHPMWHSYGIYLINLRPHPGIPDAVIHMKNATHEIIVVALNPEEPLSIDEVPKFLTPPNFCGQFIEPSDEAAAQRIVETVQDVIDGKLNPDTDYGRWWIQRFSASNIKDPETFGDTRIVIDKGDGSAPVETVIKAQPGPQDMH